MAHHFVTNIKDDVMVINFKSRDKMNEILDELSNAYEGFLNNREGHNFPSEYIPNNKKHVLYKYKFQCKYVIGVYKSNSLAHEMCHAKYYIDEDYKNKIDKEWEALTPATRDYLIAFLKRLGYSDKVLIDEYQAYRYTEADNFFGIKFK